MQRLMVDDTAYVLENIRQVKRRRNGGREDGEGDRERWRARYGIARAREGRKREGEGE
jgi:hypothetical protein